jgi:glycosyltransferase involved in cell wall biosynthesis
VLPSFAEGLPVVLMEALTLSRPVITTAIAGIPELVDQECGWLIPAGSEDALVAAMTEALRASPEELGAKGAAGRDRVHRMHDASRNAALVVDAIGRRLSAPTS